MNQSSRNFLDTNRGHYDLLIKAQVVKHLDAATRQGLLDVIRMEFDGGYNANLWCPECVTNMLRFVYEQYDKYLDRLKKFEEETTK